jgi:hypothetical protein
MKSGQCRVKTPSPVEPLVRYAARMQRHQETTTPDTSGVVLLR